MRLQTNAGTVFDRISLNNLSPDEHRARYFEMKAAARERDAASERVGATTVEGPALTADAIVLRESIPYGWYWTGTIPRGHVLRIVNTSGTAGVSAMVWNADDTSERYNAGDTVKVQWNALLRAGRVLLSDMGRVLFSLTADTAGRHDTLAGGSTPASNAAKYGDRHLRNTRDNFLLAAAKHGLTKRDIAPCVTFFAPVVTTAAGRLTWSSGDDLAGSYVDLRAEMNVLVALSNCHHPLAPESSTMGAVEAIVWRGPAADAGDACRTSGPEAIRVFQNTDALFRT
jgi:urea carboxylase-associated protein 2